ncbi:hypothetical protein [Halobacillus yeomjeoni]|nr:hypothetical protein [Halobacillus yeomjeoni]
MNQLRLTPVAGSRYKGAFDALNERSRENNRIRILQAWDSFLFIQ